MLNKKINLHSCPRAASPCVRNCEIMLVLLIVIFFFIFNLMQSMHMRMWLHYIFTKKNNWKNFIIWEAFPHALRSKWSLKKNPLIQLFHWKNVNSYTTRSSTDIQNSFDDKALITFWFVVSIIPLMHSHSADLWNLCSTIIPSDELISIQKRLRVVYIEYIEYFVSSCLCLCHWKQSFIHAYIDFLLYTHTYVRIRQSIPNIHLTFTIDTP